MSISIDSSTVFGEPLTVEEYKILMNEIWKSHRFGRNGKSIKYITPTWDMRDGKCFNISFDDITFDYRGSNEPMYDRILNWLDRQRGED